MEFLILTCSRTNEVRFAEWHEIDLREKLWSIPADKMKMKKPHTVPLSDAAVVEILSAIYEMGFLSFSYIFRPGCGQHDALDALATAI